MISCAAMSGSRRSKQARFRCVDDRPDSIEQLGTTDGMVMARAAGRRFPGILIQGDTLFSLLTDLEEEAPEAAACRTVRTWLDAYETLMASHGLNLPYPR
jgi:hypothetical protein